MAELEYIDQSADDLWLTLADGELDMSQFSILTEGSYVVPGLGVIRAGIIGASHFLALNDGCTRFTEVFACIPEVRTERTLERASLGSLLERTVTHARHQYRFEATCVAWNDGIAHRDVLLDQICSARGTNGEIGLLYRFPDSPHASPVHTGEALTAVWVRVEGVRISVRTLHAYPDSAMVFTTSSMEGM